MFGSKIILGILIGVFVVPAVALDPIGTFNTFQGVVTKLVELGGVIGGSV